MRARAHALLFLATSGRDTHVAIAAAESPFLAFISTAVYNQNVALPGAQAIHRHYGMLVFELFYSFLIALPQAKENTLVLPHFRLSAVLCN
jgi:hypothetical protein